MTRSLSHLVLAIPLMLMSFAPADEPPSPAARIQAIKKDVADAEAAYWQVWQKLPDGHQDDPEANRLRDAFAQKQRDGMAGALEIAQADPQSEAGFEALEWLLLNAPGVYSQPAGRPALELMARYHAANPRIGQAVARIAYFPPYGLQTGGVKAIPAYQPAMELLKAVAENNSDRFARGQAAMGMAWQAKHAFGFAAYKSLPEAVRYKAEAEQAFESVIKEYDDCLYLGMYKGQPSKSTLGKLARSELFELRNLQPGNLAPDIEGEDLDGLKFKLSDYRGKVVLLVFWGAWCGPCMAAVPHERELVEHFQGRPFAVIGINSDEDKTKAARAIKKNQIPWRSFWNGPDRALGRIAVDWNVHYWPTVYVIDHHGVVRHAHLEGKELDEPLAKLVAEAEAKATKGDAR